MCTHVQMQPVIRERERVCVGPRGLGPPFLYHLLQALSRHSACSWCSAHCSILWGPTFFFSLFPQSLKSDEEAESTKEPQIELFEAQGKAWPVGGAPTGQ